MLGVPAHISLNDFLTFISASLYDIVTLIQYRLSQAQLSFDKNNISHLLVMH